MAGDIATGVEFSAGLGAMGGDGVSELLFEDSVGLVDLVGVVRVALVGRGEVEKMELLADDLALLGDEVLVEVTVEEGSREGVIDDAHGEMQHEVADKAVVVVIVAGMTIGVDHLPQWKSGSGGSFGEKFFESRVQSCRDDNGCAGFVGAWRGKKKLDDGFRFGDTGLFFLVGLGLGHNDGGWRRDADVCSGGSELNGLKMRNQGLVPVIVLSAPEVDVVVAF